MRRGVLVATGVLLCFACKRGAKEVVVHTSFDQPFSEPIFKGFEKRSGIKVLAVYDTEETKSTGVVNRLVAEARQPQAEVARRHFALARSWKGQGALGQAAGGRARSS
jgi:iron(III) transport system substrate-binding protein